MCLYSLDQKQKNRPSETFNIDSDSKLIAFEICGQQTCIRKRDLILDASALHRKKPNIFFLPGNRAHRPMLSVSFSVVIKTNNKVFAQYGDE